MNHDRFEGFLWGQVLLFGLLGATLALFLRFPTLRAPYALPELKVVLATVFMIAAGLVAILTERGSPSRGAAMTSSSAAGSA